MSDRAAIFWIVTLVTGCLALLLLIHETTSRNVSKPGYYTGVIEELYSEKTPDPETLFERTGYYLEVRFEHVKGTQPLLIEKSEWIEYEIGDTYVTQYTYSHVTGVALTTQPIGILDNRINSVLLILGASVRLSVVIIGGGAIILFAIAFLYELLYTVLTWIYRQWCGAIVTLKNWKPKFLQRRDVNKAVANQRARYKNNSDNE